MTSTNKPTPRISINLDVGGMDAIMGSLYKKEANTSFYNAPSSDMHRTNNNNGVSGSGMRRSKSGNSFTSYHKAHESPPNPNKNAPASTGGIKPYHGLMRRRRRTTDNMLSDSMISQILPNLISSEDHDSPNKLHRHNAPPDAVRPSIVEPNGKNTELLNGKKMEHDTAASASSASLKEVIQNLSRVSSASSFSSLLHHGCLEAKKLQAHNKMNSNSSISCNNSSNNNALFGNIDKKIKHYRSQRRRSVDSDTCSLPSESSGAANGHFHGGAEDYSTASSRMRRVKSTDSIISGILNNTNTNGGTGGGVLQQQHDKAQRRVSWSHLHSISLIDLDKSPDVTRALNVEWKEIGLPSMPFSADNSMNKVGGRGPASSALEERDNNNTASSSSSSPAVARSVYGKSIKSSSGSQEQQDQRRYSVDSKSTKSSSGGSSSHHDPIMQKMHTQQAQQRLPTTRVIALPWTDSRGIQGEYTGEVDSSIQPHGNGTFKPTSENESTFYSSTWHNGAMVSATIPLEGKSSDYMTKNTNMQEQQQRSRSHESLLSYKDYTKKGSSSSRSSNESLPQQQQYKSCFSRKSSMEVAGEMGASSQTLLALSPPNSGASSKKDLVSLPKQKQHFLSASLPQSQVPTSFTSSRYEEKLSGNPGESKSCFSRKSLMEAAGATGASSQMLLAPSPRYNGSSRKKEVVSLPKQKQRFLSASLPQSQVPTSFTSSSPSYEEEVRGGLERMGTTNPHTNAPAVASAARSRSSSHQQAIPQAHPPLSSNPQGDDLKDEAISPVSVKSAVSTTSLSGYHLGHPVKDRSHMIIPSNTREGLALALRNAYALKALDFAFILRSNGEWTYSIVADRPVSEDGPLIRFVLDGKGSTKTIRKKYWAKGIRCVNTQLAIFAGLNGGRITEQDLNESDPVVENNNQVDGNASAGVVADAEDDDGSDPRESNYNPSNHHGDRRETKNIRYPSWRSSADASADDSDVAVIADNNSSANSSAGDSTPSNSFHAHDMAMAHKNTLHESLHDFHASCSSRMTRPKKASNHHASDVAVVHSNSFDDNNDFHASSSRMSRTKSVFKHNASDMAVVHDNSLRSSQSTNENNGMDVIDENHHSREADVQEDHNHSSLSQMSRKMSSRRIIKADNPQLFSSDKAVVEGGSQCSTTSPARAGKASRTIDKSERSESERSGNTLGSGLKAILSLDFMGTLDNVDDGEGEVDGCNQSTIPSRRRSQEVNTAYYQPKRSAGSSGESSDGSSLKTMLTRADQKHAESQNRRLSDTSKYQQRRGSKEDSPQCRSSQGSTSLGSSFPSSFTSYLPRRTSRGSEDPSEVGGSAGRNTKMSSSFHTSNTTQGAQHSNTTRRGSNSSFHRPVPTRTNGGYGVLYAATRRGSLDSLRMSVPTKTNDGNMKTSTSAHSLGWDNNENIPLRAARKGSNSSLASFHCLTREQISKNRQPKRRSSIDSTCSVGSNVSSFSALLREIYSPEYLAKAEDKMHKSTSMHSLASTVSVGSVGK